jgi:hypothetical protein
MNLNIVPCFRKFIPKKPNNVAYIMAYTPLSLNRGIAIYGTTSNPNFNIYKDKIESVQVSMLSIDFYDTTYKLIGPFYDLPGHDPHPPKYLSPELVVLIYSSGTGRKMHFFKFNEHLSLVPQKAIGIPTNWHHVNLVDGRIVLVKFANTNATTRVEGFVYMTNNNLFVNIENSAASLSPPFLQTNNWEVS